MRDEGRKRDSQRKATGATEHSRWVSSGVHPAFLKFAAIYKVGVKEIQRIQSLDLTFDKINAAKGELAVRVSNRINSEVSPLMPSKINELSGGDIFYDVSFEALKIAQERSGTRRIPNSIGLMEFDAQQRFGEPLQTIVRRHLYGDPEATTKYLKLEQNRQWVRYGLGLPSFRGNLDHRLLIQNGLGLGLENLTEANLEEFFDEFCPCTVCVHDSSNLAKLRRNVIREACEARESITPKFTDTNQKLG